MNKHLTAFLGLDKTGFDAGLNSAGKQVNKFGSALKSQLAGAFGTAAIVAYTKYLIDAGSQIADLSSKTGVGVETLQELGYAAAQSGSSLEAVTNSFRALAKARAEAMTNPNSTKNQAFGFVGISPEELKTQSIEKLWKRIAETIRTTDFGASELAIVDELLGRAGSELIPTFKEGIEDAAGQARNLGIIMDSEAVTALKEAGDLITELTYRMRAFLAPVVKIVANQFRNISDFLDKTVGGLGAFIGTVAGGGSIDEAFAENQRHIDEVNSKREADDKARADKAERLRNAAESKADTRTKQVANFTENTISKAPHAIAAEKAQKGFSISENSLGRIGAFSGAAGNAAVPPGQQIQIQELQKIRDALVIKGIIVRDSR